MKKLGVALLGLTMMGAQAAAPALSIEQAAKIASDYLREHGLAKEHAVTSLALEPASLLRKEYHWVATWTPPVDLGNRREIGLQISMDGTTARVVDKPAK